MKTPEAFLLLGLTSILIACDRLRDRLGELTGQAPDHSPVLAKVDDVPIRASRVNQLLEGMSPAARQATLSTPNGRRALLNNAIDREIQLLAAREAGLDRRRDFVESVWNFRDGLLLRGLRDHLAAKLAVSDDEARRYYLQNPIEYGEWKSFQASRIHLRTQAEAHRALALHQKGRSFESVFRLLHPELAAKGQGVEKISLRIGQGPPAVERALSAMRVGQISSPMPAGGGAFYLLRKEGEMLHPSRPFDVVQKEIVARIQNAKLGAWLTEARSSRKIEVHDVLLESWAQQQAR